MLEIIVLGEESFNEDTQEFVTVGGFNLQLEHSLAALSKWESEFEKPFLVEDEKTPEEIFAYIKAMILNPYVPLGVLESLSEENFKEINAYMNKKMTATWFSETSERSRSTETITSELVYYWMTMFNMPIEYERWHLNRLFTALKIASVKQSKPKKMSPAEMAARRRKINAERKARLGTTG